MAPPQSRLLEQPSIEARNAYLAKVTAGDPKLKEAVEAPLANDQADTFLDQGAAGLLRESMEAEGRLTIAEERIGDFIGRYKLLEKIGEGGFGVVYRAEQTEPVCRHVALRRKIAPDVTRPHSNLPKISTGISITNLSSLVRRTLPIGSKRPFAAIAPRLRWLQRFSWLRPQHGCQRVAGLASDQSRTKRGGWTKTRRSFARQRGAGARISFGIEGSC
ncbi:MAG: hypothetical protein FJ403_04830 [Verrucomicrobia bacterium]|nr:hypothetical protein [Verrucomicrobiota bacterium]